MDKQDVVIRVRMNLMSMTDLDKIIRILLTGRVMRDEMKQEERAERVQQLALVVHK